MINKNLRKYLASRNGNEIIIWSWNNPPAKQWDLLKILHQFLMDRNINLRNLNGDYRHFMVLVAVPGAYMTKFSYGHGIGVAGIGQIYPVANKILPIFVEGV